MTKTIDYFYSHFSPWTYLGHARFLKIAEAAGASVTFKPSSFGTIFPQSGGLPLPKRAAGDMGLDIGKLSGAILYAVWNEERNLADENTLVAVANEQGMDGAALLARSKEDEIGRQYEANTQEAMDRNVFGAPTYIYRDELFWGQDRLDFVERALAQD
jgi:2-hydroxychromene-2-carboxylate isomerase